MTVAALATAFALLFGATRRAPSIPSLVAAGLAVVVLKVSPATPGQAVIAALAAVVLARTLRRREEA